MSQEESTYGFYGITIKRIRKAIWRREISFNNTTHCPCKFFRSHRNSSKALFVFIDRIAFKGKTQRKEPNCKPTLGGYLDYLFWKNLSTPKPVDFHTITVIFKSDVIIEITFGKNVVTNGLHFSLNCIKWRHLSKIWSFLMRCVISSIQFTCQSILKRVIHDATMWRGWKLNQDQAIMVAVNGALKRGYKWLVEILL